MTNTNETTGDRAEPPRLLAAEELPSSLQGGIHGRSRKSWPVTQALAPWRGFTLLEVLVALAVLAIALGTAVKGVSAYAANTAYLRNKALAQWVATNRVMDLQARQAWPAPDIYRGREEMAGHEWHWQVKVSTTPKQDIRRLDVQVHAHADDQQSLANLVAYLGAPTDSSR